MNWHVGIRGQAISLSLLVAVSIGVLDVAEFGAESLRAQNAPAAASQNAQTADGALEKGYKRFMVGIGMADEQYQAAVEKGQPLPPRFSFTNSMRTSAEEEETIYSIMVDAYKDMKANDAQYASDTQTLQSQPYSRQRDENMQALYTTRGEKEQAIVRQAMTQLRAQLTEEDFQRLDHYIRVQERVSK